MVETFFKKAYQLVDPKIKEILALYVDPKKKHLINYQISSGGKRLRPALAIASCLACKGKTKDVLYAAAGLEILHNCTLIFDDIIDKSILRRGRQTVWAQFGESIAQCVGLNYTAAIFQAANRSKHSVQISEILAKAMKTVMEGEVTDILFEQSGRQKEKYVVENRYKKISKKDYLQMTGKKTASLTEACCEAGAVCAGSSKKQKKALKQYGFSLGIAFQIRDDILDVFGKEKEFGKKIGKDIEERKLGNIVILCALQELTFLKEQKSLSTILKKKKIEAKDIQRALGIINKTKAREKALALEKRHIEKAKKALRELPQGKWNKLLFNIADFVVERNK